MTVIAVRDAFFVTGLILAFASVAVAQGENQIDIPKTTHYGTGGSQLIYLLTNPGVQKELKLGENESTQLMESLRKIDPNHRVFRTPRERRRLRVIADEKNRRSDAAIQKSLNEEQFRRFQELELQYLSGGALLVPRIAERLALTDRQQEQIKSIDDSYMLEVDSASSGVQRSGDVEAPTPHEKYDSDLLGILTPEQAKQLKTMAGDPFKLPLQLSGPSWQLVLLSEVQKELRLSEDVSKALGQSLAAILREGAAEKSFDLNSIRQAIRQSQKIIDTVNSALSESQWNRLQQLILQENGPESFAKMEVCKALGLSSEQQDRVHKVIDEYWKIRHDRSESKLMLPAVLSAQQEKLEGDLLDILTPDQKKLWKAMQGAIVEIPGIIQSRTPPVEK